MNVQDKIKPQYPLTRSLQFSVDQVQFLDGSRQSMPRGTGPQRRWRIKLSDLTEEEALALRDFVRWYSGQAGTFSFTDPDSLVEYTECFIADGEINITYERDGVASADLVIEAQDTQ